MLGVTFGNKHSYNDWGIWLEDTHINPPLPKRYIVDVPARNGLLDLTPELTPTIRFENRTLTFNFRVKAGDWSTLMSQIYGQIHGQTLDVVSDLDPQWHWHGCVTVDDFSSDERTGVLVITVDADPFKLSNTENSYTVNGNGTITCVVDRMEISPAFEIEAPTTVIYGDSSYVIESTATTEKTLSGDIVSFADGTANPVVDLTADIDAVQDLHGYDAPWVGGAGKNLLPLDVATIKSLNTAGTWNGNVYTNVGSTITLQTDDGGNVIGINVNGTATINFNFQIVLNSVVDIPTGQYTYTSGTTGSSSSTSRIYWEWYDTVESAWKGIASDSFTTNHATDKIQNIRLQIYSGVTISNKVYKPMLNAGTTALPFAPYTNICPISGWDEVNVTRTGKNLVEQVMDGYVSPSGSNGIWYSASPTGQKSVVFYCMAGKSYTISGILADRCVYAIFDSIPTTSGTVGHNAENLSSGITIPKTITPQASGYCVVYLATSSAINTSNVQIELGSTATAYEPYNGTTYTTDLDGTRYGGTLDVTTGVLTVTWKTINLGDVSWTKQTIAAWNCFSGTASGKKNGASNLFCSHYPVKSIYNTTNDFCVGGNGNSANIYVRDSVLMQGDATAFQTAMANAGVQVCYELATPLTVQLTAEQVMILKNQNNIWADSGEVEVTYLAQDFAGRKFFIPDLELTEGSHSLTIQGTGTTTVTYTNGRL